MAYVNVNAVVIDDTGLRERLKGLQHKHIPRALKVAVNNLAKDTVRVEKLEMVFSFERPTPWTLRGLRVAKWATENDPTAAIWFKDVYGKSQLGEAVEETLRPQIEGGSRKDKQSEKRLRKIGVLHAGEYLINTRQARKNVYGNIPGGRYQQMLSYFRAYWEAGSSMNRVGSTVGKGKAFFIQDVKGGRGIFERVGRGKPRMLWYVTKQRPRYRPRFDFYGTAHAHARRWGPHFADKAKRWALKRLN